MATKQELFTKVTGLTFDVEAIKDDAKLAWLIPDGAMLDNPEGRKAKETAEFMEAAGLDKGLKYDEEEPSDDDSSFDDDNSDDPKSTADVINGD